MIKYILRLLNQDPSLLKLVTFEVPLENYDLFMAATVKNRKASVQEPGVVRFEALLIASSDQDENGISYFVDINQQKYAKVVYLEGYRQPEDFEHHKQTQHFKEWYQTINPLLRPGSKIVSQSLSPFCQ